MSVKDRLILFLKLKNISKTEFGKRIGVSSAYITSMRSSMQPDKLKSVALEFPDLNIDWLLTGDGEMLIKNSVNVGDKDDIIALQKKLIEKHEIIDELKKEIDNLKKALADAKSTHVANVR